MATLGPNINTNKCDVLIAVGMRFDDRVTGNLATYAKQAKVIHFDIDPAEVNKNVHADIAVLGDCKETLGCRDRATASQYTYRMAGKLSRIMNGWKRRR